MVSCSTRRIDRHRAGRDAGAAADDDHLRRAGRDERRQVAEHPLQPHVLRLARRLHLAGVVIVAHAVGSLGDRDRGVPSFADVDHLGLPQLARHVAAVGDEHAGHRMDGERQQPGDRRPATANQRIAAHVPPQQDQAGERGQDDQQLLRALRAQPHHQQQAGAQRADDRAERVGGVDAADQPRRIVARCAATDASASGKLAPQRIAPGSTANRQRARSSWN